MDVARTTSATPAAVDSVLREAGERSLVHAVPVIEIARRQKVALRDLFTAVGVAGELDREAVITADLEIKYAGYLVREREAAARLQRMATVTLAPETSYAALRSVSTEAKQKLAARRPATLAEAASIPGVTPADLQNLLFELGKW